MTSSDGREWPMRLRIRIAYLFVRPEQRFDSPGVIVFLMSIIKYTCNTFIKSDANHTAMSSVNWKLTILPKNYISCYESSHAHIFRSISLMHTGHPIKSEAMPCSPTNTLWLQVSSWPQTWPLSFSVIIACKRLPHDNLMLPWTPLAQFTEKLCVCTHNTLQGSILCWLTAIISNI